MQRLREITNKHFGVIVLTVCPLIGTRLGAGGWGIFILFYWNMSESSLLMPSVFKGYKIKCL